jgi:hypothetical protein
VRAVGLALFIVALVPTAATAAPRSERGSVAAISVDPSTDLVDGQHVTVSGSGWAEFYVAVLFECSADLQRCAGPFGFAGGDDDGNFEVEMMVRATFTDEDGPVDCRSEDCVVAAGVGIESAPAEAAPPEAGGDLVVPVAFDPSAPLLDPPSLIADPSTDLVDDQEIVVTGERYVPEEDDTIVECPAGFTDAEADCRIVGFPQIGDFGELEARLRVRALLPAASGEVDCRATPCVLAVFSEESGEVLASTPVTFDADAPLKPPAELAVSPSTGLVDGQTVTVVGTHFSPGAPGVLVQCPADPLDFNDCAFSPHRFPSAGAGGRFEVSFEVAAEIRVGGRTVDCRRQPCVMWAGDAWGDDGYNTASASIVFGDQAGPAAAVPATPAFTG